MSTASRKTETFTQRVLLALLTAQADLTMVAGHRQTSSGPYKQGYREWISYPAARAAIEETIGQLIRALATEHGIPASYPPMG